MYFLYSEFWALINHLQNKYAIIWCASRKKLLLGEIVSMDLLISTHLVRRETDALGNIF